MHPLWEVRQYVARWINNFKSVFGSVGALFDSFIGLALYKTVIFLAPQYVVASVLHCWTCEYYRERLLASSLHVFLISGLLFHVLPRVRVQLLILVVWEYRSLHRAVSESCIFSMLLTSCILSQIDCLLSTEKRSLQYFIVVHVKNA